MIDLKCDICGGKLIIGSGGIVVCEVCGIEHSKNRVQEKVQEISGVVKIDNSHMIGNFFKMAENACEAENYNEIEMYANKIIEIEPNNYKAWFLKGKGAGWQSTLLNNRTMEAANCFGNAIDLAPVEEKEKLEYDAKRELRSLSLAFIIKRGDIFISYPTEDDTNGFLNDISMISNAMKQLSKKVGQ